jgi:predicted nucleotidyltransferase component of viral defense system
MRYGTASAFREALERRLLERARAGESISRLRKQVVFERFLSRLQDVAPDRWLLKGGFALELRLPVRARATKDIDLDWDLDEDQVVEALLLAAQCDLRDFFEFRLVKVTTAVEAEERGGRWQATVRLAGRTFEQVTIDVACSVTPLLDPERIAAPALLGFAGLHPVTIPAAALEQHLAEKLHAYTRRYPGDQQSSRVKDLVDVALIGQIAQFDARRLRDAIERLFARRATHAVPASLPSPPSSWAAPHARLARKVGLDEDLAVTVSECARFLDPVLARAAAGEWDPSGHVWRASGPAVSASRQSGRAPRSRPGAATAPADPAAASAAPATAPTGTPSRPATARSRRRSPGTG